MSEKKRNDEAYIRIGDTAVLLSWQGEGRAKKIVGRIVREIPPEVMKVDPDAAERWTMEELLALGTLIEKAATHAITMQSANLRVAAAVAAAQAKQEPKEGAPLLSGKNAEALLRQMAEKNGVSVEELLTNLRNEEAENAPETEG